ncbi:hypothetical protein BT96DRAFT_917692 [Gymnopus androsaceus JB14]|uniref:RING-CH-type domain-containing protein n=1 Tax=Gymnopus androsaceus JB14 TaxID=1447944 RepID=A0A6A4HX30_9AGAR|nr:hypothetical protein BT96DRAFT_917692 [Gymnopus androsaceus JB14]
MSRRRSTLLNSLSNEGDRKAPTVNDLRLKECYICRDEERFDDPSKKRREWVHPCKCTLIAHQSCLMHLLSSRPTSRPKCPQCGYEYQVEKNLPLLVTSLLFRAGDALFQAMGTSFIVTSAVGLGAFAVSGLFALGTGYGALAVREYFGAGLFDLLLTDEPTNWHIGHHLFFFLTPIRLISPFLTAGYFEPFFFLWPSIPRSVREQLAAESNRINGATFPARSESETAWRPGLKTFGCIVFATSTIYNRLFPRFSEWVLGMKPPQRSSLLQGLTIRRILRRQEGPNGEEQEAHVLQVQREVHDEPDSPFANLDGVTQYPNISIMTGLLKPFIASGMGHLLYLGAQHSSTLRFFLGIQRPAIMYSSPKLVPEQYESVSYWRYFTDSAIQQMDPVWIRNSVGLGVFVVLKDCVHLFHLWLTKRELNGRKLKNRDFSGVDPKELDLIRPVPNPTST